MCLDDQIAQAEAGIVIIERKVGTVSAEVRRELAEDLEMDRSYPEPRRRVSE